MNRTVSFSGGKHGFECPADMEEHIRRVFQGEYDVPIEFEHPPSVLDIGANVGAFCVWAACRWNTERITCYEPHPTNFEMLKRNILKRSHEVKLIQAAVVGSLGETTMELHPGLHNLGESSLLDLGEQDMTISFKVDTIQACNLESADIVKIDTEGMEIPILSHLDLSQTTALLVEWHSAADRRVIDASMTSLNTFELVGGETYGPTRGTMKFVRK